ncbi:tetratricopeptide repeat protein [Breznakiellaceae bacterium SP9]
MNCGGRAAATKQAIKFNPNYAKAYDGRCCVYFIKKDNARARADFTQALRINPQLSARNNLEYLQDEENECNTLPHPIQ